MFRNPLESRMRWFVLAVFLLGSSVPVWAQLQTGNIFGRTVDPQGEPLPGVTVTLSGPGAPQTFITDSEGRFRFLSLSPGFYSLRADLAGLGSVRRDEVQVNIGRNTDVELLVRAAVAETITVTADTPLLDVRQTGTGATVTEIELEEVPTARDPWVILQQVPGVLMDRANVGGDQSGQQSQFVSKGATGDEATFNVDGINITDMSATGSSPMYFDFGSFEELQITTGGTDPRIMTPGAQINIVTKRGGNAFDGSARYYIADGSWQTDPEIPTEARSYLAAVNEIDQNVETGIELGGPVVRDRLWLWGAWADQQVDLFVSQPVGQDVRYADKTTLETMTFKLNAQPLTNNSFSAFWTTNDKIKVGRDISPSRPPETAWYQSGFGPEGNWKIEDTHVFGPNFFATALYSKVNGGFQLIPEVGAGCQTLECAVSEASGPAYLNLDDEAWHRAYVGVRQTRPQEQWRLDTSAFFDLGATSHEIRVGAGTREAADETQWAWPHDQYVVDYGSLGPILGLPEGFGGVYLFRGGNAPYEMNYDDFYVGDTILWDRLTVQAGLRYDRQSTRSEDASVAAHPLIPDILPAISYSGDAAGEMEWESISPRLGFTYAAGADRRTLIRGAYNRYAGQLGGNSAGAGFNTQNFSYQFLYYFFVDENGDKAAQRGEILFDFGLAGFYGVDPANPGAATQLIRYGDDVDAPTTDEFIIGFEREIMPAFTIGLNYTHRQMDDFIWLQGEKSPGSNDFYTRDDYVPGGDLVGTLPDGTKVTSPYWKLKPGSPALAYFVVRNRPGYGQTYDGVELTAVKRMSNRWMMRGNVSWNDWRQQVDESSIIDPTRALTSYGCSICDDAVVVQGSGGTSGAKGGIYIGSGWSYALTGVYQIPVVDVNFGLNVSGREGYPLPYVHQTESLSLDGGRKSVLMTDVGDIRHEDLHIVDLRLAKDFSFRDVALSLSVDAFNVTNQQTILQRRLLLYRESAPRSGANEITELVSPAIFRLGAKISF